MTGRVRWTVGEPSPRLRYLTRCRLGGFRVYYSDLSQGPSLVEFFPPVENKDLTRLRMRVLKGTHNLCHAHKTSRNFNHK